MRFLSNCAVVVLALSAAELLPAQYPGTGYPGSPYPGGQTPGTSGPGIPWPRRGKKGGGDKQTAEATTKTTGTLRKLDEKVVEVEATDGRVLHYQRDEKTKFSKQSKEIPAAELRVGDQVTVESTEDKDGNLHARAVQWEKSAPVTEAKTQQTTAAPPSPGEPPAERTTTDAPPPEHDPSDPGPPVLKRGGHPRNVPDPEDVAVSTPPAGPEAPGAQPETAGAKPAPRMREEGPDPTIEKARLATAKLTEKLPNYVCKEFMTRFQSSSHPVDWRALDVVSTEVVYDGGKESYRNVEVNGKPTHKPIEETGGAWSTGEFGTMLLDLFSPSTAAEFRFRKDSFASGSSTQVYHFTVERQRSHWHVEVTSQSFMPAYQGSVWIEPKTGQVLRIEMQARLLPQEFPLDTIESAVDYSKIRIGENEYLLPVHAETLACQRGSSNCSRNTIDFRNYHKFSAQSDVTFAENDK